MAKKPKTDSKPKSDTEEVTAASVSDVTAMTADHAFLCPKCAIAVSFRCSQCRATVHVNAVNNKVVWMRNGKVVRAFLNPRRAYVDVATENQIPPAEWAKQYRS